MSTELERIARLEEIFAKAGGRSAGVEVGIGDDAAVLVPPAGERLVWTVDAQVEGVHFERAYLSCEAIGYRAVMSAASDLAAMGARPWSLLSSIVLPAGFGDGSFDEIARGIAAASSEIGAAVVGGNLARGSELGLTTTLLGTCRDRAVTRRGARSGERVLVAGALGLASAGLRALAVGKRDDEAVSPAIDAWQRPRARVVDGLSMGAVASACIDVSDGLARDAAHLARASGVRVVLDRAALLVACGQPTLRAAAALGVEPLDLVLHGGEDYALVCTSTADVAGFAEVGSVEEGEGVWLRSPGASGVERVEPRGYDHFAL